MTDPPSTITVTFNQLPAVGPYRFQLLVPELDMVRVVSAAPDRSIDYFMDCSERETSSPTFCDPSRPVRTRFFINGLKTAPKSFRVVAHINGKSFTGDFSPQFDAKEANGPGCQPIVYTASVTFPDIFS